MRINLSNTPRILSLIMHSYVPGDSELVARTLSSEIDTNCATLVSDFFVGLAFGKYDIILEFEPTTSSSSVALVRHLRQWILLTKIEDQQLRGCISNMVCYEIEPSNTRKNLNSNVRAYSLFRTDPADRSAITRVVKYARKASDSNLDVHVFWNSSAMSYMLRTDGRDIERIFSFIYRLREHDFLRDFCTFVTLNVHGDDRDSNVEGFTALINIKIGQKGLARRLLDQRTRIRLGFFDLVREVDCGNLSSAFDAIQKTRAEMFLERTQNLPHRTATILSFERSFLRRKKARKI